MTTNCWRRKEVTQLRERWREVQASFVDDPGQAVSRADELVDAAMSVLTDRLAVRRDALGSRWRDRETSDTEALRMAMRRYSRILDVLLKS